MTSPGTMKTIQKRLYTYVPRVRSNSASSQPATRTLYTSGSSPTSLSFFDSPPPPTPPPTSRLNTSPARLPIKGEGSGEGQQHSHSSHHGPQPPFSLALTSAPANPSSPPHTPAPYAAGTHPFFPYGYAFTPGHPHAFYNTHGREEKRERGKRRGMRYQLDVGAYGIAKKRSGRPVVVSGESGEDLGMSVQVGEDAYFVRDNAMGVADGVGGWAKARHTGDACLKDPSSSPSALFARRLMNFCAAESESATAPIPIPARPTSPPPTRTTTPNPWPWTPSRLSPSLREFPEYPISTAPHVESAFEAWNQEDEWADEMDFDGESESDMSEFEEGLDVLMMLERAYESAIRAHVVPISPASSSPAPSTSHPDPTSKTQSSTETQPLKQGSSTALLAVLDHSPRSRSRSRTRSSSPSPHGRVPAPSPAPSPSKPGRTRSPLVPASPSTTPSPGPTTRALLHPDSAGSIANGKVNANASGSGAVLKIAHLGDCMGMLVRGEEIVWRSDEMWWSFNTPVQLGPLSPSRPLTHAHTFTIPIRADDILILASDGLSDNLWDEEVLDEVVRMRRSFLPASPSAAAASSPDRDRGEAEKAKEREEAVKETPSVLGRRTLAGMLSEALCSRARRVSERRPSKAKSKSASPVSAEKIEVEVEAQDAAEEEDEVPFARRAREQGKVFRGGKVDDISVVVAVISPAEAGKKARGAKASL